MTGTAIIPTQATNYEVIWGEDERDRIPYEDSHDGSSISDTAKMRATRKFFELSKLGVKCGLFINGVLDCGQNVSGGPDQRPAFLDDPKLHALWAAGELNNDGSPKVAPVVEHKTHTVMDAHQDERYVTKSNGSCGRFVRSDTSVALCTCGWKRHSGTRAEARAAARWHRQEKAASDLAGPSGQHVLAVA